MVEIENLIQRPQRPIQGKRFPQVAEMSKDELLLTQLSEQLQDEETIEDVLESDVAKEMGYTKQDSQHSVTVRHVRPSRIVMFKVDAETGRIYRKLVPAKRMLENRKNGWLSVCPDCRTDCSPNPNECPERMRRGEYRANTDCPVCHRKFYDLGPLPKAAGSTADPGTVTFDDIEDTPETRIKGMRDDHIRAAHPSVARRMGLFLDVRRA